MRFLFVSSTRVGGSGRSQRELAAQLLRRGHEVVILVDDERHHQPLRWIHEQLADASVRWQGRTGSRLITGVRDRLGRRRKSIMEGGVPHQLTVLPQNAFPDLAEEFQPDVVVGNSVDRWGWTRIVGECRRRGIASILYIREEESLPHLRGDGIPDHVVANAESLARAVLELGFDCDFVPSVIDVSVTATASSREVALAINPIPSRGVDIVLAVAERLSNIPFVLQESWPLDNDDLYVLSSRLTQLPNVQLRRLRPPGPDLYRDARVVLVPYRVDNRPRVILEAQSNGIPVVVGDTPALVEAVGEGGVSVPLDDVDAWCRELARLWSDPLRYEQLAAAAERHGHRPEVDPGATSERFLAIARSLVSDTTS
jgi:glycosyltransferase involved in cell wall biosynthesis